MPPKPKLTKQQILQAGIEIVRHEGFDFLTARALAKKLNCSPCPIFTVLKNMDEVQRETLVAAKNIFNEYTSKGLSQKSPFRGVGLQYIEFAKNEPNLFHLLFMSNKFDTLPVDERLALDDYYEQIVSSILSEYNVSPNDAKTIYRHMWIYTHGLASLIATRVCVFTNQEISDMLTEVFIGILIKIKSGNKEI